MFISISYSRRVLQNCLPAFWCYIWGLKVVPPTLLFFPRLHRALPSEVCSHAALLSMGALMLLGRAGVPSRNGSLELS